MQSTIKRCTLAIIMCGLSAIGMAQDILWQEDFSDFTISKTNWTDGKPFDVKGWSVYYCSILDNNPHPKTLWFTSKDQGVLAYLGYAITPELQYKGDIILSYKYGNTSKSDSSIKITIQNGGTFENGDNELSFNITKKFSDGPKSVTHKIIGVNESTKIKFSLNSANYFVIDDVVVTTDGMTLNEEASSISDLQTAHNGKTMNVKTCRKLHGGIWNTLCLPFNVTKETMEAALGPSQDIQMRTFSSYADNVMTFAVVADDATITAGTPFLIKLNTTVDNPTFNSVTISNTAAQAINKNGVSFIGTYSTTTLNANGTHLFITTDGKLAIPTSDGTTMKGMRAYISVPSALAPTVSGARLVFNDINDDEPSSVQTPTQKKTPSAIYNLNGQRLQQLRKGLNIIDGKLRVTTTR